MPPLSELYKRAALEWNPAEKSVRFLKWAEGLAAVVASCVLTGYISSGKIDPRLEGELKACASPTFGMYVAILKLASNFRKTLTSCVFLPFVEYVFPQPEWLKTYSAAQVLASKFSLSIDSKKISTVDLLDLALGIRNRGPGHGGIPAEEEAKHITEVCRSLGDISESLFKPRILVTTAIHADITNP